MQIVTESVTGLVPALDGEYGIVLAALLGITIGVRQLLRSRRPAPTPDTLEPTAYR